MLYRPIWIMLNFVYRVFFSRLHVNGKENFIKGKPVILPCNHVNAFLDPIVLPTVVWPHLHYIVRGDIFNSKFKTWLLWQMYQIPMFRQRDGKDNMKKNEASFEKCYDILGNKQRIMIFPEGDCVQEKHLRPLKKGLARMAFGAVNKHGWDIDLQILPNTVNYMHPSKARTDVIIKVGKPIALQDYRELYEKDEARALTVLTRDVQEALKDIYIQVDDRRDLKLFEQLIEIERNEKPYTRFPWRKTNDERFDREQNVAKHINHLRESEEENLEKVQETADTYYRKLKKLKLKDILLSDQRYNLFLYAFLGIFMAPLVLISAILFGGQFLLADFVARKKIRLLIFKNSIRIGIFMIINALVVLTLVIITAFYSIPLAIVLPWLLTGIAWASVNYVESLQLAWAQFKLRGMAKKRKRDLMELAILRKKLVKEIKKVGQTKPVAA